MQSAPFFHPTVIRRERSLFTHSFGSRTNTIFYDQVPAHYYNVIVNYFGKLERARDYNTFRLKKRKTFLHTTQSH